MYPRVVVRDNGDMAAVEEEKTSYLVGFVETLSLEAHCSSRDLVKSEPPRLHTKILKPQPKSAVSYRVPMSKVKISKGDDENHTKIIRTSSVPRPRAVLSSPDNDEIIGNLNELNRKRETMTPMRMQNHKNNDQDASTIIPKPRQLVRKVGTPSRSRPLCQNKQSQVKVSPTDTRLSAPRKAREIRIECGKDSHLTEKSASKITVPKLRPTTRSTREITIEACKNTNVVQKPASNLTKPKLKLSDKRV